jgi:hypothetical protein
MWKVGLLPSPMEFSFHRHFYKLSCSSLAACLFTALWGISPHPPSVLRVPHPLCYMSFLLLLLIFQFFFLFFPGCGVGLSRGLCWSGPGWSAGIPHAASLTLWSAPSQAVCALVSVSGVGALLVSPFNMKWECYVQAGGVEGSKFFLFSVVFPCKVYLQHLSKILL